MMTSHGGTSGAGGWTGPAGPGALAPAPQRRDEQSTFLFLGLYLLLLAFFIMLTSFSSFDEGRQGAVVSSIQRAFAGVTGNGDQLLPGGDTGPFGQARQLQDRVADAFETAIPLANIIVRQDGRRLDVDVPSQTLFPGDSLVIRDPLPLLDRIIATVSSAPAGLAYDVAVVASVAADGPFPTDLSPSVGRAGVIARAMLARGMPPERLSIGLEHGDPRTVRFVFLVVEEGQSIGLSGDLVRGDAP